MQWFSWGTAWRGTRRARLVHRMMPLLALALLGTRSERTDAQSSPIVAITPHSKLVAVNAQLEIGIDWCGPGGQIFATQRVTLYPATGGSVDLTPQFSQDWGWPAPSFCQGPDDYYEHWTGVVTIPEGGGDIGATAIDYNNYQGSDDAVIKTPVPRHQVTVVADAPAINVAPSANAVAKFVITNFGSETETFSLARSCTNLASCGNVSPTQVVLNSQQSANATISIAGPSTGGTSGSIALTASNAHSSANASIPVNALAPATPGVLLAGGGDVLERSLCLTVSAGSELVFECGDLRVVHALPSVRTLNTERTPTLVFGSQHANPFPVVSADVAFPSADPLPTTVQATLIINGTSVARSWNGSDWGAPGQMRRIAIGIDAVTWATGVYDYQLEVRRITGGSNVVFQTVSGQLPVVNRIQSPFGAGWWLAGLERLVIRGDGTVFWIGGDGSTHLYRPVASGVWTATAVTRPDTLTFDGTTYERHLPNKLRVRFDANGLHMATVNRLGHQTAFHYATVAGRSVLDTLTLPVVSGTPLRYVFHYNGNGQLTSVDAPGSAAGSVRTTTLTVNASIGRIDAIQDPDLHSVSFAYDATATRRMTSRTDRRGYATTFTYDAGGRLTGHALNPGGGAAVIAQGYRPVETVGLPGTALGAAQPMDSVLSLLDGPRTDVSDTWRFSFTRFGALQSIQNPLRRVTSLVHGDARWPGLTTQLTDAAGFVSQAFYNGRGLLDSTKALNFTGNGQAATTSYAWNATWDLPDSVTSPTGIRTKYALQATTGNRLWQQTGPDSARIQFGYDAATGLLTSITVPGTAPDLLTYDGTLGNLRTSQLPNGRIDSVFTDAAGRDTLVRAPIDATHKGWSRTSYDAMNRITKTVTFGPAVQVAAPGASFTAPADSLVVDQEYDAEGNVTRVARARGVRFPGYAPLAATYNYDGAGRVTSQTLDGRMQTYGYDPAGNVLTHGTGRGTVANTYDALGQLRKRVTPQITYGSESCETYLPPGCGFTLPNYSTASGVNQVCIPADTAFFDYDAAGRVTTADNIHARVRRGYRASGLLVADTLNVRSYYSSGSSPCEALPSGELQNEFVGWPRHLYVLTFAYDLEGRRTTLTHPEGTQSYAYDSIAPRRGLLVQVKDVAARSYSFEYDAAGRRRVTRYPGSTVETLTFSTDGRLSNRAVGSNVAGFIGDAFTYDLRDRVISVDNAIRGGVSNPQTATTWYNGLGAVVAADNYGSTSGWTERFDVDALGNRVRVQQQGLRPSWHPDYLGIRFQSYDGSRLTSVSDTATGSGDQYSFSESYGYHGGGALVLQYASEWDAQTLTTDQRMTRSYYSIDDQLRAFARNAKGGVGQAGQRPVFEEYRYDALGRRVLTRSRRLPGCYAPSMGIECTSYIERVVWDGDQVLLEDRANGAEGLTSQQLEAETSSGEAYGRVVYTHAAGIDAPLAASKNGLAILPQRNWRGQYEVGAFTTGASTQGCTGGASCPILDWPGGARSVDQANLDPKVIQTWFGSLIPGRTDGSGLVYLRNRYYDPRTGRFTQQDPIGLAGGLNAYGFAGGDPVSYSDPFGLCPWCVGAGAGALLGAGGTVLWNYAHHQPLTKNLVRNTLIGAAAGATLGLGYQLAAGAAAGTGAGAAASAGGTKIALGISEHLDEFAERYGAATWEQWGATNFKEQFMETVSNTSNKILFNLQGVDVWGGIQRAARGAGGATDWELMQIRNNPQWWDRIQWMKDGVQVANPFAK
jgi:RHS repeat-associated protein